MLSFNEIFRRDAAPRIVRQFGDRDDDGALRPATIVLESGESVQWVCIVGRLRTEMIEEDGRLVAREACELNGATADLETEFKTLPETAQITVQKYGLTPFQLFPALCEFGGPMTKITAVRKPVKQLNPLSRRES